MNKNYDSFPVCDLPYPEDSLLAYTCAAKQNVPKIKRPQPYLKTEDEEESDEREEEE